MKILLNTIYCGSFSDSFCFSVLSVEEATIGSFSQGFGFAFLTVDEPQLLLSLDPDDFVVGVTVVIGLTGVAGEETEGRELKSSAGNGETEIDEEEERLMTDVFKVFCDCDCDGDG